MSFDMEFERKGRILIVHFSGSVKSGDIPAEPYKRFADICHEEGLIGVLLACRALSAEVTTTDEFFLGSSVANLPSPRIKIAALLSGEHESGIFSELVSMNRGGSYKVFTDESQAVEWLS